MSKLHDLLIGWFGSIDGNGQLVDRDTFLDTCHRAQEDIIQTMERYLLEDNVPEATTKRFISKLR